MFAIKLYFFKIYFLQSILNPASPQAEKIHRLFNFFNIAAAGMLLLVCFLVTYICIKYRQKKDDDTEPKQVKGNNKLEAVMIAGPTLLLIWFFYETVSTMKFVAPSFAANRQPDVIITAHQWWWEVKYPSSNVTAANEVHLPSGKPLLLEMRSADVIHDWWVPALGNKMDMIPNLKNYLSIFINKPGDYFGICSEFCGAQHAWMRIHVIAQNENDFNKWISDNTTSAPQPNDSIAVTGAALFQTKTCGSCHRIQGTEANGNEGPDLTHIESRQQLLSGMIDNNEKNLSDWINHPQHIKPGAHMPDFILNKDSLNAIVHYLNQLK